MGTRSQLRARSVCPRYEIWRAVLRELWPGLAQMELAEGTNVLESIQNRLLWSRKAGYICLEQARRQGYMYVCEWRSRNRIHLKHWRTTEKECHNPTVPILLRNSLLTSSSANG